MKARKGLKWLACALVGAASMVLLGCPHNNLIENDVVSGGGATSGRGSNGGVQLVITNFVSAGAGVNGPTRTVAPEHIDLTKKDRIDEYIFVVTGTGETGVYGPKIVDIAETTGVAELPNLDTGRWDITIDAYNVEKLKAANIALTGPTKEDVINQVGEDVAGQIVPHKANAVVLSGQASLYLGGNTKQVTLTLTSSSQAENGDVDVAIYFSNPNDFLEIFNGINKYKVKARLVDPVTFQAITGVGDISTEVSLYDVDQGHDVHYTTYDYNKYDKATSNYSLETINAGGDKKILKYKPENLGNPLKIKAGKYMLLVEIETPTGEKLYASDPELFVEGNRTTKGVLEIKNLMGEEPKKPLGLEVYYSDPSTTGALTGYNATFKWGPDVSDFAVVGYELQIADITDIYVNDGASKIKTNDQPDAGETFTAAGNLWETYLDQTAKITTPENYVTTISWMDQTTTPQYPWKSGSLLLGNDTITLGLQDGHVYSARIRSTNGYKKSQWTYLGTGTMQNGTDVTASGATKFNQAEPNGIFNLVTIAYKLTDVDMYNLTNSRQVDMRVDTGDDVLVKNLLQKYEYDPNVTEVELNYGFEGAKVGAALGDSVLVAKGDMTNAIVQSWQGWQNEKKPTELFGPAAVPPQITKADWKYSGFRSMVLIPVGAGGSSLKVDVHTADTTNVLGLETIGFATDVPTHTTNNDTLAGLTAYSQSKPAGVYKNTAGNQLVIVLAGNSTPIVDRSNSETKLYVSIGNNNSANGVEDQFTDKNGKPITVTDLSVSLQRSLTPYKTSAGFTAAVDSTNPSYICFDAANTNKLNGLAPGLYTMYIKMTIAGGQVQSFQLPVTILYTDQANVITTIP